MLHRSKRYVPYLFDRNPKYLQYSHITLVWLKRKSEPFSSGRAPKTFKINSAGIPAWPPAADKKHSNGALPLVGGEKWPTLPHLLCLTIKISLSIVVHVHILSESCFVFAESERAQWSQNVGDLKAHNIYLHSALRYYNFVDRKPRCGNARTIRGCVRARIRPTSSICRLFLRKFLFCPISTEEGTETGRNTKEFAKQETKVCFCVSLFSNRRIR